MYFVQDLSALYILLPRFLIWIELLKRLKDQDCRRHHHHRQQQQQKKKQQQQQQQQQTTTINNNNKEEPTTNNQNNFEKTSPFHRNTFPSFTKRCVTCEGQMGDGGTPVIGGLNDRNFLPSTVALEKMDGLKTTLLLGW